MRKRKHLTGRSVNYADGETVFEEGSDGQEVYFIISGRAEVSQRIGGNKEIINILEKGDFFGEMAALNNTARSMTIIAIGELHLYELSLDEMFENMHRDPVLLRDVCTNLARRLRDANLRIKELILTMIAQQQKKA